MATTTANTTTANPPSPTAATVVRTASPPWTQIVRGPDTEAGVLPENFSDGVAGDNGNAGSNKKPAAWGKKPNPVSAPSNGVLENGAGGEGAGAVVMGAEQWPSLSECTKASPKVSDSKSLAEFGSVTPPQVSGAESVSSTLPSPRSPSSTSHKPTTSDSSHNSVSNNGRPSRQKSMKRDGGATAHANGGGESSHHHHNHNHSLPNNVQNHGHRDSGQRNAVGDPQHRNSFRRNAGPHSRGDGSHFGSRRGDGNSDWSHQRSFNGRDASMQRGGSRSFVRPTPVSAPFGHPSQAVRPFFNPMVVSDVPPIVYQYQYLQPDMIFIPPGPHMFYSPPDKALYDRIVSQIDYYFSNENLVKDTYLRRNMNEHGWVSVDTIANFKKVLELNANTYQILEAVKASTVVEVQGDKIRKRGDWLKWIMPPSVRFPSESGSQSPNDPAVTKVTAHLQSVTVNENTNDLNDAKGQPDINAGVVSQSASGDSNSPSNTMKDEASSCGC